MKKISTVQTFGNGIFKGQKLTIGLDLGDRWSFYCVLDEAGEIILEQKVATTPEALGGGFQTSHYASFGGARHQTSNGPNAFESTRLALPLMPSKAIAVTTYKAGTFFILLPVVAL